MLFEADHGVSSDAWSPGSRGDHGGGECGLVPGAYRPLDWAWPLGGVP